MNLFEAENKIKNFSDEQLGQEMLQPSGMVPQYMIMSELNRRKTMRQEASAKPQPNTSIADEMKQGIMQIANQGGPQQQYAEGGLVGYQAGGMTDPRYSTYGRVARDVTMPFPWRDQALRGRHRVLRREAQPLSSLPPALPRPGIPDLPRPVVDEFAGTSQRMIDAYENEFTPPELQGANVRGLSGSNVPPPGSDEPWPMDDSGMPYAATPNPVSPDNYSGENSPFYMDENPSGWMEDKLGLSADSPINNPQVAAPSQFAEDFLSLNQSAVEEFHRRNQAVANPPDDAPPWRKDAATLWNSLDSGADMLESGGAGIARQVREYFGFDDAETVEDQNDPTPSPHPPGTDPKATSAGTSHIKRDTGSHKAGAGAERNTDLSGHAVPAGSTVGVGGQVNSMDEFAYADRIKEWLGWEPGNDAYDEYEDKLEALEAELTAGHTQDKWMALAQLGATMASTPGDFATAWGAGVNTGIDALRESKDQQRENKLAFLGMEGDLVAAREAARRGDVDTAAKIYAAALDKTLADRQFGLQEKGMALKEKALAMRAAGGAGPDFTKEIGKAVMDVFSDPFARVQAAEEYEKQYGKKPTDQELVGYIRNNAAMAFGYSMAGMGGAPDPFAGLDDELERRAPRQ